MKNKFNLNSEEKHKTTKKSRELTMKNSNEVSKQNTYNVKCAVWLGFKCIIFIVCMTCFFHQSVQFYLQYITYPTKTSIMITNPVWYTSPAVTFCDRNPVPRSEFCARYSNFCEKPNDLTKFCLNQPHFCKGNISDLMIPQFGYFTQNKREEVEKLVWELLLNSSGEQLSLFQGVDYYEKITFVYDELLKAVVKCQSNNLHLSSKSEPKMREFQPPGLKNYVSRVVLDLNKEELFYPWLTHQVFFAVHSPLVPINPFSDGRAMKPGHRYIVNIRLEEEHLLPHPYQTNCTDYKVTWKKNNKTGPRSQQMCRDMCTHKFSNLCYGCVKPMEMVEKIENMCSAFQKYERHHCERKGFTFMMKNKKECNYNCKEECLKVKYLSTIDERVYEPNPTEALEWTMEKRDLSEVNVLIRDTKVTVISHDPLYSNESFFSHIGGLIGCWLGISVWAFTNIIEGTVLMATNWMKKFRKKKQEIFDDAVFYPTHITFQ